MHREESISFRTPISTHKYEQQNKKRVHLYKRINTRQYKANSTCISFFNKNSLFLMGGSTSEHLAQLLRMILVFSHFLLFIILLCACEQVDIGFVNIHSELSPFSSVRLCYCTRHQECMCTHSYYSDWLSSSGSILCKYIFLALFGGSFHFHG